VGFSFMAPVGRLFEMSAGNATDAADVGHTGASLLLTAGQLAELLNIGKSTIWRLHAAGKIPMPVQIGRATRWRTEEVQAWVSAGCPSRDRWNAERDG
jgi:excisionase family DNA binding protein